LCACVASVRLGRHTQTASSHLAKLVKRELLTVEKRGPRRFYRLATPLVAQMLEGIMTVAVTGRSGFVRRPKSTTKCVARELVTIIWRANSVSPLATR
jgi:DNA-binding transcriptional ArsR family regulator